MYHLLVLRPHSDPKEPWSYLLAPPFEKAHFPPRGVGIAPNGWTRLEFGFFHLQKELGAREDPLQVSAYKTRQPDDFAQAPQRALLSVHNSVLDLLADLAGSHSFSQVFVVAS